MFSLRAGQTLLGLVRAHTNAQRRGRYWYWLGLALAAAFVAGVGVGLARAMFDVTSAYPVTSVPAASYEQNVPLAPNSIVAAYGVNLATKVAYASSDDNPDIPGVQLPTELGGTTVEVNGKKAGLFFVSPGQYSQVNYVMPEGTAVGKATVVIRAGDGTISTGSAQIAQVSPAIFTANASGAGVPAALLLRVKSNGEQSYESILLLQKTDQGDRYIPKPIDMGPEDEHVFLIIYLGGVRYATPGSVRVLIGGIECTPLYSGAAPGFVALDQINVEIPRSLIGRGSVKVSVTTGVASSNLVDIEMAGDGGSSPPRVSGFGGLPALAGQPMIINGSGFSPVASENTVRMAGLEAEVMEATTTSLKVMVPFGVETGTVRVITPSGEGLSASIVPVRTSISGLVEDTSRQPLPGVTVSIRELNMSIKTDLEGHFVLPDIPKEGLYQVDFDGGAIPVDPPYPLYSKKIPALMGRDNSFTHAITLQQETGSGGIVGSPSSFGGDGGYRLRVAWTKLGPDPVTIKTDDFRLEIQGSTKATFPNNGTIGEIFLTPLQNARTPVELPFGYFSSSIVQITPFGVVLDPGAKLVFPNKDGLPPGASAILFRYDQNAGKFVQENPDTVKANVSADGKTIETDPGAIKITSYYFAAMARDMTTIRGYVFEKDGRTPVNHALVRFRGQEAFTDGAGSYVLRYVSVKAGQDVSVEVSAVRPNGRVDRAVSAKVPAISGNTTKARDALMPYIKDNRPPTIIGPTRAEVKEGETVDFKIFASDPDPGQTLTVKVEGAPFAKVFRGGPPVTSGSPASSTYSLRLSPGFTDAGPWKLTLIATDDEGGETKRNIDLTVKDANRAPTANSQTVIIDEDTVGTIKLTGSDPDGDKLDFTIVDQPLNGRLSGDAPYLTYRPKPNFAGADRFTFKVSDGNLDSATATVTILVRAINDPPVLTVPGPQTANEGQTIAFTISATDHDAGQILTITASGLPAGASFIQSSATGAQFRWTPGFSQAGTYTISFRVADNAVPSLSDTKEVRIRVFDAQHDFAEDPADLTVNGVTDPLSPSLGGAAGSAVAIGDLDGDGIGDLVIGAPADNGAGRVYVLLGRSNPRGVVDLVNKPADVIIRGEAFDDQFGSSLAIGDINGDGKADLIIGAPAADASSDVSDSGKVYAVFGPLTPGVYDIGKIANLTILGAARGDHLGASLAVGKIGGASAPDTLIIGAPLFDVPETSASLPNAGCVYGFFGGAALAGVRDLGASSADFTIAGVVANGQLGYSLATGNFNADDSADIAIGAPTADSGSLKAAGVVYLVLGSQSLKGAISPVQIFNGADSGDAAGSSVAMGDLNGDGYADLIIGAPEADGPNNTRPGSGEVYILFGMPALQGPPSQLTIFGGGAKTDAFPDGLGSSVAAGDFTGDGKMDLIMGAPGADSPDSTRQAVGAAYVIFGGAAFTAGTFDLTSDTPDLKIFGAKSGDRLGNGGFAFGKLDLAGANGLAIGVPSASKGENASMGAGGAGEVRVLHGVIR